MLSSIKGDDYQEVSLSMGSNFHHRGSIRHTNYEARGHNLSLRLECLEESRIVENEQEYADTLDSQRTIQAGVEEAIPDDVDANFVINDSSVEKQWAGPFPNVAIYITEKIDETRSHRWVYSQLVGNLSVTIMGEIEDVFLARIKLFDIGSSDTS